MAFSRQLLWSLTRYTIANKIRGRARFPFVLMLEPTLRCNLACAGCGHIRELKDSPSLSVAECLSAVDESGAPIVSITGGEPLLHPDIVPIVDQILARGRGVTLCTNGLLLEDSLDSFSPGPYLSFVVHPMAWPELTISMSGVKGFSPRPWTPSAQPSAAGSG